MTQAFLLFLRAMQASMALEQFPNGDERPIAYASSSLNSSEKNYGQIEKEGQAIIFGVTKFYMYLFGRKFTLRTDHKPLLKIFASDSATTVLAAARLQHWSLLSSYHYEIEFKSSAEVASADSLSRLPLQYRKDASVEEEIFHEAPRQLNRHRVSVTEIAKDTSRNPLLAKALFFTQKGWPILAAPILTSSHTSPTDTNSLQNKAVLCGACQLSYLFL